MGAEKATMNVVVVGQVQSAKAVVSTVAKAAAAAVTGQSTVSTLLYCFVSDELARH